LQRNRRWRSPAVANHGSGALRKASPTIALKRV